MQTIVPHASDSSLELLAHRALESAAVVVARRGKNASARFSSVRRRAIPDARSTRRRQRSRSGLGGLDDDERVAVHHRTVVPGTQLGGKVASTAAQQGRQFIGVVIH